MHHLPQSSHQPHTAGPGVPPSPSSGPFGRFLTEVICVAAVALIGTLDTKGPAAEIVGWERAGG